MATLAHALTPPTKITHDHKSIMLLPPVPPPLSIGAGPTMGRLFVYLSHNMTCSAQQFSLNTEKSVSCPGVGGILVIRPASSPVVINALSKRINSSLTVVTEYSYLLFIYLLLLLFFFFGGGGGGGYKAFQSQFQYKILWIAPEAVSSMLPDPLEV